MMTYTDERDRRALRHRSKPPLTREDWRAKRAAVDAVLDDVGGVVTRVGDETVGEMWSLFDGQDVLNEIDPQFSANIAQHVRRRRPADPFHVSANTDPKGDRSAAAGPGPRRAAARGRRDRQRHRRARRQVRDRGGLRQPGVREADDRRLGRATSCREYAVGFVADMGAPGMQHICRSGFAGRAPTDDYPLSSRFDEIDTMIVFDDVEIPWENVFFYRHTRAARFIRATLHRYSMFPFVQRHLRFADFLVGVAYPAPARPGSKMHQGVREKLAELACYREGINAHLTAAIEMAETSPGGLLMPNQALLYAGRVLACSQLPAMMHLARDLCGGQICVTPGAATFEHPGPGEWLREVLLASATMAAEDRRRLLRARPRPAQLRLRRPPADVPAVRAVAAVLAPAGRLQQLRLRRPARC